MATKIVVLKLSPKQLESVASSPTHEKGGSTAAGSPVASGAQDSKAKAKKRKPVKPATAPTLPSSPFPEESAAGTPRAQPLSHKSGPTIAQATALRALDRSGRPCRKWTKEPIKMSSFTGFKYTLSSWTGAPGEDEPGTGDAGEGTEEAEVKKEADSKPAEPRPEIKVETAS